MFQFLRAMKVHKGLSLKAWQKVVNYYILSWDVYMGKTGLHPEMHLFHACIDSHLSYKSEIGLLNNEYGVMHDYFSLTV